MELYEQILRVVMIAGPIAFVLAAALVSFYVWDEFRNHESRRPGTHSRRKPRFFWELVEEFRARKEEKQKELVSFFANWRNEFEELPVSLCRTNSVFVID